MPRKLAAPIVVIALTVVAVAPAGGAPATPVAPPATVKLVDCSREARSATLYGRMKSIEGSERMWMRFTLLERRAAGFEVLAAPGLGRWHKSKPGVGAFGYRQTVRGLQQGASYRMQVNYRWYSAEGELLASARRRSVACRQFERLPNLTARVVEASETDVEGVLRYGVMVANTGEAAAGDVAVRMAVDDDVLDTVTVGFLRSGESRLLRVRGPRCISSVSATVDPDGVLVESSEEDNVEQLSCADVPAD
jgi:CARDB